MNDQFPEDGGGPVPGSLDRGISGAGVVVDGLPSRAIDYDARPRDAAIEASRHRAAAVLRELIVQLSTIEALPLGTPVQVKMECDPEAAAPNWAASSVGRELQFLVSHSIHHYALIKLLVAGDGIGLDADFGLAPSTLSHGRATR